MRAIELSDRAIDAARAAADPHPGKETADAADAARDLGHDEAAHPDHLDDQQVAHRPEQRPSDDARRPGHQDPGDEQQGLSHDLRRLGENQRGHARLVGNVAANEPRLDRLPADASQRGDHVDGLARRTAPPGVCRNGGRAATSV